MANKTEVPNWAKSLINPEMETKVSVFRNSTIVAIDTSTEDTGTMIQIISLNKLTMKTLHWVADQLGVGSETGFRWFLLHKNTPDRAAIYNPFSNLEQYRNLFGLAVNAINALGGEAVVETSNWLTINDAVINTEYSEENGTVRIKVERVKNDEGTASI